MVRKRNKTYLIVQKKRYFLYKIYFNPKISSAEQSIISHNLANVVKDGKILPERY